MSIKLLDDDDLTDMETSVRSGVMASCGTSERIKELYGPFASNESFSFLRGFRKVLLAIAGHIREKGSENVGKTTKLGKTQQDILSIQLN